MRSMVFLVVLLAACTSRESKTVGSIERIDAGLDKLISSSATLEIIGEGFEWSEGPVWVGKENMLLFSDVPKNIIYKWTEEKGVEPYLTPSGFTGTETTSHEPGSNGLIIHNDSLVLCQHGDRRIAKMNSSLDNPTPNFSTVSSTYEGKRFSSPNDAVYRSNGDLYLTDPPYGLGQQNDDPEKEQPHNGVYRVSPRGDVSLLIDSLTLPNGIIFLPGEKKFIVSNSDPAKAIWYEFELNDKDSVQQGRVFYNATSNVGTEKGLPDGLKADRDGNIFASGPGGIWIFNPAGTVLGKIKTPEAVANCALSPDEKTLYITSDMYLLRLKMRD